MRGEACSVRPRGRVPELEVDCGHHSTKDQYARPVEGSLPVRLTHCRKWNVRHCLYPFLILRLVEEVCAQAR